MTSQTTNEIPITPMPKHHWTLIDIWNGENAKKNCHSSDVALYYRNRIHTKQPRDPSMRAYRSYFGVYESIAQMLLYYILPQSKYLCSNVLRCTIRKVKPCKWIPLSDGYTIFQLINLSRLGLLPFFSDILMTHYCLDMSSVYTSCDISYQNTIYVLDTVKQTHSISCFPVPALFPWT
jgi:hypothetical protein